jgi:hypothetical protein
MDKLEELKAALFQVTPDEVKKKESEESVGVISQEMSETMEGITLSTLDLSALNSAITIPPSSSYSINTGAGMNGTWFTSGAGLGANGSSPAYSTITSSATPGLSLDVNGDANFEGDIKWKGRSLTNMIETIEKRLAILTPDPKKLEKYEALQKAYEHYKLMEKLCHDNPPTTGS